MPIKKTNIKRARTYLDYLYSLDYVQKPVSIRQFIEDPYYLGVATKGGQTVYEVWKDSLDEVFLDDSRYLAVLTGAIGIGKTYTACIGMAYVMYLFLCLKDPWGFFSLGDSGKMAIAFFNLTKTLGSSRAYTQLQTFLTKSPFFLEHGDLRNTKNPELHFSLFEFILASPNAQGFGTIGAHVICAIMDEVNDPTASAATKKKVLAAYDSTSRRFVSRFVKDGITLGRFFLVSSKQDELSFLDMFIEESKGSGRIFIKDIPIWEAKPKNNYCGEKFCVALGDAYTDSEIFDEAEKIKAAKADGRELLFVPVEYRPDFERDMCGALRDIAGISTEASRRSKLFPSEKLINECFDGRIPDPVNKTTVIIGVRDEHEIINFIDLGKIQVPKSVPRYVHMDIAFADGGDCLGLAMSCVPTWVDTDIMEEGTGRFFTRKMPLVITDFVLRIKAATGDSIPTFKVRKFILRLRREGFNIQHFSADLKLASNDTFQIFEDCGVNSSYLSLDRNIQPYMEFKNLVLEKRWRCYKNPFLFFELKHLEYDTTKQKIDHPEKVKDILIGEDGDVKDKVFMGSKDLSDAVVGSVFKAIELSPMPADMKAMENIMRKTRSVEIPQVATPDTSWWMDAFTKTEKPDPHQSAPVSHENQGDLAKFKDILKRSRR